MYNITCLHACACVRTQGSGALLVITTVCCYSELAIPTCTYLRRVCIHPCAMPDLNRPHYHTSPAFTALTVATPVHASLPITTEQLTEAPPDSPHSSKRFACAFSSAALEACSSAPHVAPLPPRHIQRRLKRVSSTFPKLLKSCFCTVSFGMERKVQTAFQFSPTLGRTSARKCASLREGGTTHNAHEQMASAHWSRVLTPQAYTHESGTTTASDLPRL